MKIAIFSDLYAPWASGGIVASVKAQKQELEKMGHEVIVFCPGFGSRDKTVINVPSHRHLKIEGANLSKRPTVVEKFVLSKFPQFGGFDLVHVHYEASCSLAGTRLARRFGVPLVQTLHGREDRAIMVNVPHPLKTLVGLMLNFAHSRYLPNVLKVRRDQAHAKTLAARMLWTVMVNQAQYADVVITPSKHFAKKVKHYGVTKPIIPVSNGVAAEIVAESYQPRELGDGDVMKMIWNSRASKEKRILPFLKALSLLKRPYLLYIYGGGNQLRQAKNYVRAHNLKVKFGGVVERQKILKRMQDCHLSVMASYDFDTQGMTLLEAEATGLPVFFCDPEMREVVPAGGFVLSSGISPEEMAASLDKIPAAKIKEMSEVMLKHRVEVMQSEQMPALAKAYGMASESRRLMPVKARKK